MRACRGDSEAARRLEQRWRPLIGTYLDLELVQAMSTAYRSIAAQTRGVSAHSALMCNIPKVLADEHGVSKATRLAHPAAKHGAWGICPRGGLGSAWGPLCFSLRCSETCAQLVFIHSFRCTRTNHRLGISVLACAASCATLFRPLASTSSALHTATPAHASRPQRPRVTWQHSIRHRQWRTWVHFVPAISASAVRATNTTPAFGKTVLVLGRPVHPSLRARSGIPRPPPQPF
jgi:hypothetical protein